MTIFCRSRLALLLFISCSVPGYTEDSSLQISANTPEVSIGIRADDRRALRLPDLQYTFRFEPRCGNGKTPRSILLSIADTRKTLSGRALRETAELVMKISPGQIAPLSLQGFCLNGDDPGQNMVMRITVYGVISAQAALLCSDDENEQMIYAAHALDLTLHCAVEPDSRENQYSAESQYSIN